MCGVFCAYRHDAADNAAFHAASQAVSHRGPDCIGHFSDDCCYLGHTRLSIVGLGEGANQPFRYENLAMTYNGEVYNYVEIRSELISLGYTFETTSDTEVVLKAFHQWGVDCFSRFNGVWALAIYDLSTNKLVAARDRFGEKPLFIVRQGNAVYLASEFQQLVDFTDREVDYTSVQMFLAEGTFDVNGRTFFRMIDEFPKAHYFEFDTNGGMKGVRYWDYWDGDITEADDRALAEFSELLSDAVRIRLRSEVPYSILLSGGVDSTIIAALMRQWQPAEDIPAFTYASADACDESRFAAAVADRLQMSLTVHEQDRNPKHYIERLKKLVFHLGRGHSSPAIVSVDYLFESIAESGIRVALDGQGADELLAGYTTYHPLIILECLRTGRFRQAFFFTRDAIRIGLFSTILLYCRNVLPPFWRRLMRRQYGYEKFFACYRETPRTGRIQAVSNRVKNKNWLNRYLIRQHDIGLGNLLFYEDVVAMKNSVENRSPYTDYRLVDFVFRHGDKLKLWNGQSKFALRWLPVYERFKDVLERPKIGFSSDIQLETKMAMIESLRRSPILEWPILSDSLKQALQGDTLSTSKYERFLFRLYQVHLWHELFHQNKTSAVKVGDKRRPEKIKSGARFAEAT